ncbi:DUF1345 domain-containing protein [Sphingomonas psychrotolerans]|uniref:DUF1345 domain-containing protein n=1 Tax=Sphingomonas psychrotolerans TaxID=1327635 RepID=A0ABU3N8U9_9SPHN|nr:DUF1345 domain-containing protein [Sphingomonas psychrotolerans]MDT8759916.1 DUF1345 domain-containing protein [Sphingomonas psychrotolerans]
MANPPARGIGNLIAPPRFLLFLAASAVAMSLAIPEFGLRTGVMTGFDAGATIFLIAALPLLGHRSDDMRRSATRNDANRLLLLFLTLAVSLVVLVAVASELMQRDTPDTGSIALIVGTLVLSWVFSNTIYALHYAHLYYRAANGGDAGGLQFPEEPEPDYWDFVYFAFCLGMTFQTSDVSVTDRGIRKVVTLHCLAAFVFNLGIVAFTINVLGA